MMIHATLLGVKKRASANKSQAEAVSVVRLSYFSTHYTEI